MLRWLLAVLLAANLGFLAWSQGWLGALLPGPDDQREPERLERQVQPELIRLGKAQLRVVEPGRSATPAPAASQPARSAAPASAPAGAVAASAVAASAAPPAPAPASVPAPAPAVPAVAAAAPARADTACFEAGFYSEAELARLEPALQRALPAGSWRVQDSERPSGWVVYTGRYPNREALLRRQDELRQLRVEFIEMRSPPELAMGLSLGRFRQRENAERHLEDMEKRGVRNARVVPVGPPVTVYRVQVPAADAALRQRLADLPSRLLIGREFEPCTGTARPAPGR
ncbi:hypothetical protein [Caldimonas tepidiphila]|uniref:hypothetical protein n=1 Tax=Caldimonas tepidiphila TaxID=2315841 RepID=UPI000E5B914C|nr:hypothetical protein [Caldimonas tepidiphila]